MFISGKLRNKTRYGIAAVSGVHGGKDTALQRAIEHRDVLNRRYPPNTPFKPNSNNKTGINGISETYQMWSGKKFPCFNVSWVEHRGEPSKIRRFYFHHFANREEALAAATKFRKEREAEILERYRNGEY